MSMHSVHCVHVRATFSGRAAAYFPDNEHYGSIKVYNGKQLANYGYSGESSIGGDSGELSMTHSCHWLVCPCCEIE